jgi:hypothetical protein
MFNEEKTKQEFFSNILSNIETHFEENFDVKMNEFSSVEEKWKDNTQVIKLYEFYCKILGEKKVSDDEIEIVKIMFKKQNNTEVKLDEPFHNFFAPEQIEQSEYNILLGESAVEYYENKIKEVDEEFKSGWENRREEASIKYLIDKIQLDSYQAISF